MRYTAPSSTFADGDHEDKIRSDTSRGDHEDKIRSQSSGGTRGMWGEGNVNFLMETSASSGGNFFFADECYTWIQQHTTGNTDNNLV